MLAEAVEARDLCEETEGAVVINPNGSTEAHLQALLQLDWDAPCLPYGAATDSTPLADLRRCLRLSGWHNMGEDASALARAP